MKTNELYQDMLNSVEGGLLVEAVRFGSRQKELIQKYERQFKCGVEYEFHVDRDVVGVISSKPEDYMDEAIELVKSSIYRDMYNAMKPLATLVDIMSVEMSSYDEIEEMIDDANDGDPTLLRAMVETFTNPSTKLAIDEVRTNLTIKEALPEIHSDVVMLYKALPQIAGSAEQVMMAIKGLKMTSLFDFIDAVDDATRVAITKNIAMEVENSEWFYDEVERKAYTEAKRIAKTPTMGFEEDYVEWVKDNISDDIKSLISSIEVDSSVEEGVEVISKPLSLRNTILLMKYMFSFINKYGYTTKRTGMHVNISIRDFGDIDPLQVMTLMDSDFFQNFNVAEKGTRRDIIKWDVRNDTVERNTKYISSHYLESMADAFLSGGTGALENVMRDVLVKGILWDIPKYRAINWDHFLKNYNPSQKRIEFRFFGGEGYQNRFDEIVGDIMFICYVILAASKKAHTQDHMKGMLRILDRATKVNLGMSFADLVQQRRQT